MSHDFIQSAYRRTWLALVLRGVLALVLGVFILARPLESIASFALLIAIWALFTGILQIVHAVDLRPAFDRWWVMLLGGLVSTAFGIAALFYYPVLSLTFAVIWVSWWLLFTGAMGLLLAFHERQVGMSWVWTFALGLVTVAAGVIAFMNPPGTLAAIIGLIAGFAIVSGVVLLVAGYRLHAVGGEPGVTRAL